MEKIPMIKDAALLTAKAQALASKWREINNRHAQQLNAILLSVFVVDSLHAVADAIENSIIPCVSPECAHDCREWLDIYYAPPRLPGDMGRVR